MSELRPAGQIPGDLQRQQPPPPPPVPQVDAPPPPPATYVALVAPEPQFWWYCLEDTHPGVRTYGSQPLDVNRIFGTETDRGCPRCPGCQREVNSIPCAGPRIPPASVVEYHRRFMESQVAGGIGR